MSTDLSTIESSADILDDFELEIRISVLPDAGEIVGGFSTWQSCKGSCNVGTCGSAQTQTSLQTCC